VVSEARVRPGDAAGAETLDIMAGAPRYNAWQFAAIERYIGHRICEIGAGVGNMSEHLVAGGREVAVLTDVDPYYGSLLERRFADRTEVVVERLALPDDAAADELSRYDLDTVVALNVIEHIADDVGALRSMFRLLRPGGHVVVFVPAVQRAYGTLDRELGHVRRYDRRSGRALLHEASFEVVSAQYFNLLGLLGWWVNARVFGTRRISRAQLRLFDSLVPLLSLERHLPLPVGQSLIMVGRRPSRS
jgi:SAM-dependent methyltransferase